MPLVFSLMLGFFAGVPVASRDRQPRRVRPVCLCLRPSDLQVAMELGQSLVGATKKAQMMELEGRS